MEILERLSFYALVILESRFNEKRNTTPCEKFCDTFWKTFKTLNLGDFFYSLDLIDDFALCGNWKS